MDLHAKTRQALASAIKFRETRQEIISSNIANAETPGFKAKRLDFEEALARALDVDGELTMKMNDPKHFNVGGGGFNNLKPDVYEDPNGIINENDNTVDVQDEMVRMADNKLMYDALIQMMNKKLGMKKYIINSER
jgi:flagellar basal-body rod protein FlgB